MATQRLLLSLFALIGGEDVRAEIDRSLALADPSEIIANVTRNIAENSAASPVTLWQASDHGVAAPAASFTHGIFIPDPAGLEGSDATSTQRLDLEVTCTSSAGAVTGTRAFRVPIQSAFLISSAYGGATGAAMTDIVTRIRVSNDAAAGTPAGSNNLQGRLILWK